MSKFSNLFDKIEVFEKLAVYGNRQDFLQSLARDYDAVDNAELTATINAVRTAVQNYINTSADKQEDITGGQIRGLPPGLRDAFQVVRATNEFNLDTLPKLYQALLNLSTVRNLGNASDTARSAWLQTVFPVLGTAMEKVKKQIDYYRAYATKFQMNNPEGETQQAGYQHNVEAPKPAAPAAPAKSLSDEAKSLSNLLSSKVGKLPSSKNRAEDLKNINENVKSLQRYFKALQNKNDLQSYFARMEIVKALQNTYSTLDYNDLDIVSALNSGQGVPETPDSKI